MWAELAELYADRRRQEGDAYHVRSELQRLFTKHDAPQPVEQGHWQEVIYTYDVRFLVRLQTLWANA